VREVVDENTTLVVMSDHGFAPFYWGVNLNTWLYEKGYIALKDPRRMEQFAYFGNVDWSKTKAYALGLNGIYINLEGREKDGIVKPGAGYDEVLESLERDLLEFVDPRNGHQVVTRAVLTHREFTGPHLDVGPDIIVGYNYGYRSSWKSPLGSFTREIFEDNMDAWSGDHSMDSRLVPGILIANRRITLEEPGLADLTVGVLAEFGVKPLPEMIGENCLAPLP
jgi:predicted AlkP superfamily phosphohydrolase/phosphomutase